MATLEFWIVQILEGRKRVMLRRNEEQILERLKIRAIEFYGQDSRDKQSLEDAIDYAFNGLVNEFKDETISMV